MRRPARRCRVRGCRRGAGSLPATRSDRQRGRRPPDRGARPIGADDRRSPAPEPARRRTARSCRRVPRPDRPARQVRGGRRGNPRAADGLRPQPLGAGLPAAAGGRRRGDAACARDRLPEQRRGRGAAARHRAYLRHRGFGRAGGSRSLQAEGDRTAGVAAVVRFTDRHLALGRRSARAPRHRRRRMAELAARAAIDRSLLDRPIWSRSISSSACRSWSEPGRRSSFTFDCRRFCGSMRSGGSA